MEQLDADHELGLFQSGQRCGVPVDRTSRIERRHSAVDLELLRGPLQDGASHNVRAAGHETRAQLPKLRE